MLREKIQSETVISMKAKDKERTAALRLIGAKIKDRDIELRTADSKPDDDAMVTDVLMKMAKQRRESIEMFTNGGRDELAAKEQVELDVIESFLPTQLSEDETRAAIDAIKAEVGAASLKDMGKVMGALMPKVKGRADGKTLSALVAQELAKADLDAHDDDDHSEDSA